MRDVRTYDVMISSPSDLQHERDAVEAQFGRFHGQALVGPVDGQPGIADAHAAWHRREVFKGPARAA